MKKSKRPQPPAPFVLLRDALPELGKLLAADLRKIGHPKLAEQVTDLRIYGRCPCGKPCGTFYCAPLEEYKKLAPFGGDVGDVTVAKDRIIRVETLDSEVEAVLDRLFPITGDASADAW
jgi:hypothetical protein